MKTTCTIRRAAYFLFFFLPLVGVSVYFLPRYLYKDIPADAEILIAEGWLPEEALKEAMSIYNSGEYKVFVISGTSLPDEVNVHSFGKLIFNVKNITGINADRQVSTVGVNAFGRKADSEYPHFRLFINDSLTGNAYVSNRKKDYNFCVDRNIKDINNITIEYDNDGYTYWRDRNLYVNYVSMDSIKIPARSRLVFYDMNKTDDYRQFEPRFNSSADYSSYILKKSGFKDSIISITACKTNISKTYSCALAFKEWYLNSSFKGKAVNIVSRGPHTRRTWMIYKKVLGRDTNVGVILVDSKEYNKNNWWKSGAGIKDTMDEMGSYIYTIIVLPFLSKEPRK